MWMLDLMIRRLYVYLHIRSRLVSFEAGHNAMAYTRRCKSFAGVERSA